MAAGAVVTHLATAGAAKTKRAEPVAASASDPAREVAEAQKVVDEPAARTPLPASVITIDRNVRLAEKGLSAGSPVLIRIFKAESELELWMQKDGRFELFATYPICRWSGKLGPKLYEGDKQAPEGFYTVAMPQIHRRGRWPRSLNIGFPNAFDRAMERTGSLILVHGGCTSTGCYAMTNPVMDEIYKLSERALRQGQEQIPVHVFPFRMTEANLSAHADSEWQPFWRSIKEAYDMFERTRVPPAVSVCGKRYVVGEGALPGLVRPAEAGGMGAPERGADCTDVQSDVGQQAVAPEQEDVAKATKARKVVSKTQRRRSAGRNVRKAYAEARKARVAAHAEKARARQASASRRAH